MNQKIFLSKPKLNPSLRNINSDEENITKFENSLENYLGEKKYVVALNSATSALHLALILLGVESGDEVICQSFTFVATANPIIYQKAKPIFIDSEKDTWNMCPILLEKAILDRINKGKKPKAIIFVNLYGMPAKIQEITAISKKYDIKLIEDAAEALGAEYKNRKCGTFADFSVISFNNNKIITTFGGGALICNHKKDKKKAVFLSKQARDIAPHYQHSEIGYNYRMSNVLAGIGVEQMNFLEKNIKIRRKNNTVYELFLKEIEGIEILSEYSKVNNSNHWLTCILIDEKITGFNREKLRLLLSDNNIESRPLWKPMHLQPIFKNSDFYGSNVSETLFKTGICLPSGSDLTETDLERITSTIKKLL
ncbi:aminotransferase class I/II-fold pyridoxal phosphate-dependent enzyme [Polaribacter aestuariivivens]|uniref:Aminotransferase class I/II-fold pyridoxal phosphate-dependent enzyme n=1 Tax=Polaribacter aestuariivivens TaxID=2304626 RepID=A0A5S3N1B8_9FLAO|nr:DegT/DnrJ/EryC1/StrS family aminotransferase [Polaribacter aestuariivivens]TMM29141.1 aminotransferase class I/II-fold pyridoxal phosphate-dependent enzyme [Polaribacter aestuariivivens]